jgi:asparagine synthase (glutamine-hydrolysing)
MLPALDGAIGAMSEPMVSHDCVAFYLLSQEVAKHVKVVQSGQGADEVFAGYHWYPPMGEPAAASLDGAVAAYRGAFFDRDPAGVRNLAAANYIADDDPSGRFVTEHFAREGAQSGVDRALRLDTTVMLVDDPVKRVDNMTMAWGLEGRVPFLDHELVELAATCPPDLKTAQGGKGVLKEAARRVIPSEVIDRPKGYFPVPALTHLEGPYLDLVRDALYAPVAKERGLFRPEAVDALLADPNGRLTPLRGNELWQIALLELWLQRHGIAGAAA